MVIWGPEGEGINGAHALAGKTGRAMVPPPRRQTKREAQVCRVLTSGQPAHWVSVEKIQDRPSRLLDIWVCSSGEIWDLEISTMESSH